MQVQEIPLSEIRGVAFNIRSETKNGDPELLASIKSHGLMQPILLRPKGKYYEIVAGARRFAAIRALGRKSIPAIVQKLEDKAAFEIALSENIQRRNMEPIEEARAFKDYLEKYKWGSMSELAGSINRRPSYIVGRLELIELPRQVQRYIEMEKISPSHAEQINKLEGAKDKVEVAKNIIDEKLTADQTSEVVHLVRQRRMPVDRAVQTVKVVERARQAASEMVDTLRQGIIETSREVKEVESSKGRKLMQNYMFLGTILQALEDEKIFCVDHNEHALAWKGCKTPITETHQKLKRKLGVK